MASLIEIIINADDRASHKFDQVSRNAKRMQAIIAAITLGAAAFTPALLGGLGAIAALFGTAGIAAAGFGALATTTIMKTFETASDLEDAMLKVDAAMINNDAKGYAKAMAEVQAIMNSLSEEEKRAVRSIMELKETWRQLEDAMTPVTLDLIANSTGFLRSAIVKLWPAFYQTGEAFNRMFADMNTAIAAGKADAWFEHMNTFAVPMLEMVMRSAGNVLKGFGGLMVAFAPLGMEFGQGMVNMTQKFSDWAWALQSSPAFMDFCNMVRTNTPIIFQLIGTIVDVLWQIITTLNPLTMKILLATDAFLKWAMESGALDKVLRILIGAVELFLDNAEWLVPVLASLYLGFKALSIIQITAKLMGALYNAGALLVGGFGKLINVVRTAAGAQGSLNAVQLMSPHFWLIAGLTALVAVGVLLYQNWDTIVKFGKYLWCETKKAWEGIKKSVVESYNKMVEEGKKWWNDTKESWNKTVDNASRKANEMYNSVVSSYNSMKNEAKRYLSNMADDVSSGFNSLVDSAQQSAYSMWNAGMEIGRNLKNGVTNGLSNLGSTIWIGLNDMWKSIKSWGNTFYNSGKGLLSEFADGIWSGINTAYNNLWKGLKYIRDLLPFSPAKEGPLSDLDKSGKAFFPTWYEAAMTQVGSMEKTIGGAFSGVANSANTALAGTGLEAFTGGSTKFTMEIVHKHEGSVKVDGSDLADFEARVNQTVVKTTGVTRYGFDKTSIRKI